jgi:solute carrier family 25 (mitochondrial phosphate transporter), member 23/24/25/41
MSHLPQTVASIELWTIFHDELDLDNNGHLDAEELAEALGNAGVQTHSPKTYHIY